VKKGLLKTMKNTKSVNAGERVFTPAGYVGNVSTKGPVLLSETYVKCSSPSFNGSIWISHRPQKKEQKNTKQSVRTGASGVRNTHSKRAVWEAFSKKEQDDIRELCEIFGGKFLQGEVRADLEKSYAG
jgi:hypothetical protein